MLLVPRESAHVYLMHEIHVISKKNHSLNLMIGGYGSLKCGRLKSASQ